MRALLFVACLGLACDTGPQAADAQQQPPRFACAAEREAWLQFVTMWRNGGGYTGSELRADEADRLLLHLRGRGGVCP